MALQIAAHGDVLAALPSRYLVKSPCSSRYLARVRTLFIKLLFDIVNTYRVKWKLKSSVSQERKYVWSVQQSFRLINPHLKTRKNALSHQNTYNTLLIMGRIKGKKDLGGPKKGALIALSELDNVSHRQVVRANNCNEKTVRNARKRASEAEKENLDPLSTEAHQRRPQSERPLTINDRLLRQLIRHVIKNEFQRRKPWVTIAREIKCMIATSIVNAAFKRAGYERYPSRYKSLLTSKQKL